MSNVNQNKNIMSLPPLKSFPTFNKEEKSEFSYNSDRKINSHISSCRKKNSSFVSKNVGRYEKSHSDLDIEKEKENIIEDIYTPSFSQDLDFSFIDCDDSLKLQD
jgi:hypothetical protein